IDFAAAYGSGRFPAARPRQVNEIGDIVGIDSESQTGRVIATTDERLKVALYLGSPEFMKH
ncbi:MAG: hypothetical protein K8F91_21465, partial [Candidatus Obscuribacterales bacterium]|nr:hypothetical protein [Candidatus Obscuribacterales bacterium]